MANCGKRTVDNPNAAGLSLTVQGFAGGANVNYYLNWAPGASASYTTGASIDLTPHDWNNQVDSSPPG